MITLTTGLIFIFLVLLTFISTKLHFRTIKIIYIVTHSWIIFIVYILTLNIYIFLTIFLIILLSNKINSSSSFYIYVTIYFLNYIKNFSF